MISGDGGVLGAFSLSGKVALVTGASRGLGQGMALALAQAGADVAGVGTGADSPETAALIRGTGRRYLHISADLSSISPIPDILARTKATLGRVDILVNNAGIIRRNDSVDFTEEDWDAVINVNLKSVFFLSQAVAREFISLGTGGKIINIASLLSFQGGIRIPSYTSAKSGIRGLTMLLSNEWASKGIQVNGIAPGYMVTDNTEALRADTARYNEILGRIPAGRWGNPEDMAGAVVFLASSASNYVNGQILAVDGGWLGR